MSKINCCKDCTKREVGCHAYCSEYLTQKRINDEEREKIRRKMELNNLSNDYLATKNIKNKNRYNKKNRK